MNGDIAQILYTASTWVVPVLIAVTFHEAAHGFVAALRGDDTARRMGRVTFNPIAHIDPFGTVVLPGMLLLFGSPFLFGYAKPVPVNFMRLRNPRMDMVLVAAAGPATNILLAVASALLIHPAASMLPPVAAEWTFQMLVQSVLLNVVLAVFNMLPIPPLDGGRIAVGLLPNELASPIARLEPYGLLILVGGIFILPFLGSQLGLDLNIFRWLVGGPVDVIADVVFRLSGL
ncbi:MAG: site-2 protease family protein [Acetobacterales bacterium]